MLDLVYGEVVDTTTSVQRVRKTSELAVSARQEVVEAPAEYQSCRVYFVIGIRLRATVL